MTLGGSARGLGGFQGTKYSLVWSFINLSLPAEFCISARSCPNLDRVHLNDALAKKNPNSTRNHSPQTGLAP